MGDRDCIHAPLYVTDLMREVERLAPSERQVVTLVSVVDERQRERRMAFPVPRGDRLEQGQDRMVRYVLAHMYNMVVTFAGASLTAYFDTGDRQLGGIVRDAIAAFQIGAPWQARTGYGAYVNCVNRMNGFLGLGPFRMDVRDSALLAREVQEKTFYLADPAAGEAARDALRRRAADLAGKRLCALDVGGNSIKGAVVIDGRVADLHEHKWYPGGMKRARELTGALTHVIGALSERSGGAFDAVVVGFPDIVVRNKVAGGETSKTLGMRENPNVNYETEFAEISDIDQLARAFVREGGRVLVLNDGNAASFITSIEQAFSPAPLAGRHGLFANTIGTEMGTGYISAGGTVHHVPIEGYLHVIDLGHDASARLHPMDVRSTANLGSGIPGTVQKYVSQLGLFRLCVLGYEKRDPAMLDRLMEEGYLSLADDRLQVVTEPRDMRGPLTRWLVGRLHEGDRVVRDAFFAMGKALGVLIELDRGIFPEIEPTRLLSGGIVADDMAFATLEAGLTSHNPAYRVIRLDEHTFASPLLGAMRAEDRNFAVAIGSCMIGHCMAQD